MQNRYFKKVILGWNVDTPAAACSRSRHVEEARAYLWAVGSGALSPGWTETAAVGELTETETAAAPGTVSAERSEEKGT